ncbi:hypothetical protein [Bacteroides sp. CAG:633]|uniref:hypothetical protein n=1 Tax=Bacteroides sp. CAG:633 TaxID=1262744 RepID=UPI002589D69A|nr:hypothetical protein [Bacteroides sp. CAG:633]
MRRENKKAPPELSEGASTKTATTYSPTVTQSECESCHAVLGQMTASAALAKAVQTGRMSVLAIYTEGNEEVWRKALPDMSEGWTIGADHEAVKTGTLYDLKAMPSLYLLDGQKKVLLKDAAFEEISRFLEL